MDIIKELERIIYPIYLKDDASNKEYSGNCFSINNAGLMLTAWHCINPSDINKNIKILIKIKEKEYSAKIIENYSKRNKDIAVIDVDIQIKHPINIWNNNNAISIGDDVFCLSYSDIFRETPHLFKGNIAHIENDEILLTNVIQGKGQSGSPIYHLKSKSIIGVVSRIYKEDKLRNSGTAVTLNSINNNIFYYNQNNDINESRKKIIENYKKSLDLIEERISEYVLTTDIPLQLIKQRDYILQKLVDSNEYN